MLAFTGASLISALVSDDPGAAVVSCKGLLLVAALYVIANALPGPEAAGRFLAELLIVVAVASAAGILQTAVCPGSATDYGGPAWLYHRCYRGRGFFSSYMTLAGVTSLVLLANLPRLLPGSARSLRLTLPWLVTLGGLVATYTRGAWIGSSVGALALLPSARKGRWLLLGGLVVLGLVMLGGPPHLRQRLLTMGDPDDPTVKERVYMWRSGLAMWQGHALLGVGPGGVKRSYEAYAQPDAVKKRTGHLHNSPLQILVERGVVGLLAWLWIWGQFYACAITVLRRLPDLAGTERVVVAGSVVAITGFLIGGLSEYNFGDAEVVMVAWCLTALPFTVEVTDRAPA